MFAGIDMPKSSVRTLDLTKWQPAEIGLPSIFIAVLIFPSRWYQQKRTSRQEQRASSRALDGVISKHRLDSEQLDVRVCGLKNPSHRVVAPGVRVVDWVCKSQMSPRCAEN